MSEIFAVLDNVIRLRRGDVSQPVFFDLQSLLIRTNPKYFFAKQRAGQNAYAIARLPPEHIESIWVDDNWILAPRGCRKMVEAVARKHGQTLSCRDETLSLPPTGIEMTKPPYPYQGKAIMPALMARQGIITAPCGAGKTVIGVALAAYLKQPTLILVNRKELMDQWMETISDFTDLLSGARFGAGKKEIGPITVATLQTLHRLSQAKMTGLCQSFGMILLDECHICPANTFVKTMNMFPAKYRFGLTATTDRKDKMGFLMHDTFGDVISEVTDQDLSDAGRLQNVTVKAVGTNFVTDISTVEFNTLLQVLTTDRDRNDLICSKVAESCAKGHFPLVLSTRVDHVKLLQRKLQAMGLDCERLIGEMKADERVKALHKAKSNQTDVVLGTTLADQGLDIPILSDVHLTIPSDNESKLKQQIGRVRRSKEIGSFCHDYVDLHVESVVKYYQSRKRYYRKWGFDLDTECL